MAFVGPKSLSTAEEVECAENIFTFQMIIDFLKIFFWFSPKFTKQKLEQDCYDNRLVDHIVLL